MDTERLWSDVLIFEEKAKAGHNHQAQGNDQMAKRVFEEAIALYRGDYLYEYMYDDWLEQERQKLQTLFIEVLLDLANIWAKTGHYLEAASLLKKAPLNDFYVGRVLSSLLECLLSAGKKTEAINTYYYYEELYREEYGLEISEEVRDILVRYKLKI